MTTVTMDRFKGHAFGYDVACPGFNYRLTEDRRGAGPGATGEAAGN